MRMGKKKQPTYRVVAADGRSPRDGRFIEVLGHYDPRSEPSVVKIDTAKADEWISKGAQPTDRVAKLLDIARSQPEPDAADAPAAAADAPVADAGA
jgi:small subunit ribosomal protein S16